ncbi:uncharacterized protein [Palaemon carinicauda]|uniref:uncharacterized protein n=1 Tax=Palaemon carinicauda TaxID=392227 RepID=UPI0035B5A8B5
MLSWKLYSSERTLNLIIGNSCLYCHRQLSGKHTSLPPVSGSLGKADVKSHLDGNTGKLDIFVQRIKLRNKPVKVLSSQHSSVRSRKLLNRRPEIPEMKQLAVKRKEGDGSARTRVETGVHDSVGSPPEPFFRDNKQEVCIKDRNYVESEISNKDFGSKFLDKKHIKLNELESAFGERKISLSAFNKVSEHFSKNEMKPKLSPPSNVFPDSTPKSYIEGNTTTDQVKISVLKPPVKTWKITKEEQLILTQLISSGRVVEALAQIEDHKRQNRVVPFGLLRYFCGCVCTQGLVNEIYKVKEVAEKLHPNLYGKHLCFNNYLASAYCHSGNFSRSLEELMSLYHENNKGSKKLKDAVSLIIFNILESNKEENEQMVLRFAQDLAEKRSIFHPALSVWRFCFCSSLYRHHRIAKTLVECYPELIELLPRKLTNIITKSHLEADLDLLHRTFELLLEHELTDFYASATSALLHYQCEIGDVDGVNHTMKFALALKVFLKPSQIQQFLALLAHRSKPAPLLLLEMKYKLPSRFVPDRPPEFQYKF